MARIRTIKPDFWGDLTVGECSPNARLLFIATWNIADDEGLLIWSAAYLKAQVFAYDAITTDEVEALMNQLVTKGLIVRYRAGPGKWFGWILNFRKHQKIDKPQPPKHPAPSLQNPEIREAYLRRDNYTCHVCNQPIEYPSDLLHTTLSLDHVNPKSKNGSDWPSNIRCAHQGCNASKGTSVAERSAKGHRTVSERSEREGKGREGIVREEKEDQERLEETRQGAGASSQEKIDFDRPIEVVDQSTGEVLPDVSDAELFELVLAAAGIDHGQPRTTYWMPPGAIIHVGSWRKKHGLTSQQVLDGIMAKRRSMSDPPKGPSAFDAVMEIAGRAIRDASEPARVNGNHHGLTNALRQSQDDRDKQEAFRISRERRARKAAEAAGGPPQ